MTWVKLGHLVVARELAGLFRGSVSESEFHFSLTRDREDIVLTFRFGDDMDHVVRLSQSHFQRAAECARICGQVDPTSLAAKLYGILEAEAADAS